MSGSVDISTQSATKIMEINANGSQTHNSLPVRPHQIDVLPVTARNLWAKKCPWNAA